MMRFIRFTAIVVMAVLLPAGSAGAWSIILPGDINGDEEITNQDFTLFDTTSNTNPATGPWFPPMCATNSGTNCSPADRTWMTFMVQNDFDHLSGDTFVDFSSVGCSGGCQGTPGSPVTISGDVPLIPRVNSIPAEGPGVACANLWASIFNGGMQAGVSVVNDTTGGASAPTTVTLSDVDPAVSLCALTLDATCGPSLGTFTVRIEMPNRTYTETPPGSGVPTAINVDFVEVPVDCTESCNNGVLDAGEVCDDGPLNGTTACGCQTDCMYPPAGSSCSDGDACSGVETCDGAGSCQPGTPLVCNDGDPCTLDTCDPAFGCQYPCAPAICGDGVYCSCAEVCDGSAGNEILQCGCTGCCLLWCDSLGCDCPITSVILDTSNKYDNMGATNDDLCLVIQGYPMSEVCNPGPCTTTDLGGGQFRICADLSAETTCANLISFVDACGEGTYTTAASSVDIVPDPPLSGGVGGGYLKGDLTVCTRDRQSGLPIEAVQAMVGNVYNAALACTTDVTGCCTITDPSLDMPASPVDVTLARVGYPYTTFKAVDSRTIIARMEQTAARKAVDDGNPTPGDNVALLTGQFDTTTLNLIHAYRERHGPPVPNPIRGALVLSALADINVVNLELSALLGPSIPKQVTIGTITTELPLPGNIVAPDLISLDNARWDFSLVGEGPHLLIAAGVSLNPESLDLAGLVTGAGSFDLSTFGLAVVEGDIARIDITQPMLSQTSFVDADAAIGRQLALGTIDFGSSWTDNQYWRIWEGGSLQYSNRHRMIFSDTQGPIIPNATIRGLLAPVTFDNYSTEEPFLTAGSAADPDTARVNRCQNSLDGSWDNCLYGTGEHTGFHFREGDGRGGQQEGLWVGGYKLIGGDFEDYLVPYTVALSAFVECGGSNTQGQTCYANWPGGEPTGAGRSTILSVAGAIGTITQSVAAHLKLEVRGTGKYDQDEDNGDGTYRLAFGMADEALALPYGVNPAEPGAAIGGDEYYLCGTDQANACCGTGTCDFENFDIDARTLNFTTTVFANRAELYTLKLGVNRTAQGPNDVALIDERQAGTCSSTVTTSCIVDADCPGGETCVREELDAGDVWVLYTESSGAKTLPDLSGMPMSAGDGTAGVYDEVHVFGDTAIGATVPGINSTGSWAPQMTWTILGQGGEKLDSCFSWNGWSFDNLDSTESFTANTQQTYWTGP